MAYATDFFAAADIRLPRIAIPRPRWPHIPPGVRALLMMALMISPAFVTDYIGYGVMRLFHTADQIAAAQPADAAILSRVTIWHVACGDPTAEQGRWAAFAARNGWPMYPAGGPTCFRPDRVLVGIAGLKTFNVACPTLLLSVADRRRWMDFAADHDWAPYPQAGTDCVDP